MKKIIVILLLASLLLFSCENKSKAVISLTLEPNLSGYSSKTIFTLEDKNEILPNASDIWTVDDHDFKGWAKTAKGEVQYKAGDTYSQSSSSILFAIWSLKEDSGEVLSDGVYNLSADGVLTLTDNATLSGDIVIPRTIKGRTVKAIGSKAFQDKANIKSITVPDTVITIGSEAFRGAKDLIAITIPDSVVIIGDLAFTDCSSLLTASLPDSILELGAGLFYGCEKLKAVKLPKYVNALKIAEYETNVEKGFFTNCKSLTSVILPEHLVRLEAETFYDCTSLEKIELPNKLETIGKSVFYNCTKLSDVTLGAAITSIAPHAFGNTTMTSIRYAANGSDWDKITKGDNWNGNIKTVIAKDKTITL